MSCPRCQGLMGEAHFYDLEGTQGFMWMKGWQCLNCGYAVDPVMEANRKLQQSKLMGDVTETPVLVDDKKGDPYLAEEAA